MNIKKLLVGLFLVLLFAGTVRAEFVWGGGESYWNNGSAWVGGRAPSRSSGENVTISAGVCSYDASSAGGDLEMSASSTLTIDGTGTWTQSNGGSWGTLKGRLVVAGSGTFDTGAMGFFRSYKTVTVRENGTILFKCKAGVESGDAHLYLEGGTIVCSVDWNKGSRDLIPSTISGGTFTFDKSDAEFLVLPASEFLGGTIEKVGNFNVAGSMTLAGTAIDTSFVTMAAATGSIKLRSGSIAVDCTATDNGIKASGGYLDFPANSSAKVIVKNLGTASAYETYGATGKVRINGKTLSAEEWTSSIKETATESGVELTCTLAASGMVFSDPGCGVAGRDTSAGTATIVAHIDSCDEAGTELFLVYGETDAGTTTLEAWEHSVSLGLITELGDHKGTVPLPADNAGRIYYRAAMKDAAGKLVWANPAPYTVIRDGTVLQWMGGDGVWGNTDQWSTSAAPVGGSTILIEHGTVDYAVATDLNYWGTMTIRDGGTFNYSSGNWTAFRSGAIYVEDGGKLLFPNVGLVRMYDNMRVRISEGGLVSLKGTTGNGGSPSYYEIEGGALEATADWVPYTAATKAAQSIIKLASGRVSVAGKYSAMEADQYNGGALTVGGVYEMAEDHTVNGATVTVAKGLSITTEKKVMTVSKGRLVLPNAGTAADHGIARKDATNFIDLKTEFGGVLALGGIDAGLEGDDLVSVVHATWFAGADPLVKVDAVKVSDLTTFKRAVQVTRAEDGLVEVTRKELADPPAFGEITHERSDATSMTFSAKVSAAGGGATHLYLVWGATVGGLMPQEWEHAEDLGVVTAGETYAMTIPLAATEFFRWDFILLNDDACLHGHAQPPFAIGSACAAWIGGTSQDGTVSENWADGALPTDGCRVLVLDGVAQSGLAYSLENVRTLGSWYQNADIEVVIDATPENFLTVAGDFEVQAGKLRPAGASASLTKGLCLDIAGDFTLGETGVLDATSCVDRQTGIGFLPWRASSYAGEGGRLVATEFDAEGHSATYGKILDPMVTGSGSREATAGGLIVLKVGGAAVVDGTIVSNGNGWKNCHGASSGGTINLTAKTLTGGGTIQARSGFDTGDGNNDAGCGSGGRIRLKLTQAGADFTGFTGTVMADSVLGNKDNKEADGKVWVDRTVIGGAGTIVYQLATDGNNAGRVVVQNKDWTVLGNYPFANCGGYRQFGATHIPARSNGDDDLSATDWVLDGQWTYAKLTREKVKLGSLTLKNGAILKLNGKSLKLKSLWIGDKKVSGSITAKTHPGLFKTVTGTAADDLTRTPAAGGYFEDLADAPGEVIVGGGLTVIVK